ncbi:MAG: GAF domain-containing protein, partial [Oligoflexales bacterium]|nr:GAF domain-containing protein [Oligoflexales bacterium]
FGSLPHAYEALKKGRDYLDGMSGTYGIPAFNFYESLTLLGIAEKSSFWKRLKLLIRIRINQAKMKKWAKHASVNYMHKWKIVEARLASLRNRRELSQTLFDEAVELAGTSGFIQEEALALELAAVFNLGLRRKIIAQSYMSRAWHLYRQWGAYAKCDQLEKIYPSLVQQRVVKENTSSSKSSFMTAAGSMNSQLDKGGEGVEQLKWRCDIESVFKAGQAISSETVIDRLLEKVLRTIVENIGAHSCVLLLKDPTKNELHIRARYETQKDNFYLYPPEQYKEYDDVPIGMVNLAVRTKKSQVVFDASQDSNLTMEPYVNRHHPRSVICSPLLRLSETLGIVYAENNLAGGIFTTDHLQITQLLGSQAAIAIDNAMLYHNLEQKVAERTLSLREKTNNINTMLQNLPQGIFMVIGGNIIHPEYSNYLEKIFETTNIKYLEVREFLFSGTNLGKDEIENVLTALDVIIDHSAVVYEFNRHLLVGQCQKSFPDGRVKTLEIGWNPIVNEDKNVEKMMVTVRDVTELRQLQKVAAEQQREISIMSQILATPGRKFTHFVNEVKSHIEAGRAILDDKNVGRAQMINELCRHMHAIKGNARTHDYRIISECAHEAEDVLVSKGRDLSSLDPGILKGSIDNVEKTLNEYETVFFTKVKTWEEGTEGKNRDESIDESVAAFMDDVRRRIDGGEIKEDEVSKYLNIAADILRSVSFESIVEDPIAGTARIAKRIGKSVPIIRVEGHGIRMVSGFSGILKDVIIHALSNAIDHGIEMDDVRIKKGKTPSGQIDICIEQQDGNYILKVKDDGRGLDVKALREKASSSGLADPVSLEKDVEKLVDLVFISGFSTAGSVTEISGRGVGMDVIRGELRSLGGDAYISLTGSETLDETVSFELHVKIPGRYAIDPRHLLETGQTKRAA